MKYAPWRRDAGSRRSVCSDQWRAAMPIYTQQDQSMFRASTLVQDAVARNLQTLAESSQR
jgi:hypothetical protein